MLNPSDFSLRTKLMVLILGLLLSITLALFLVNYRQLDSLATRWLERRAAGISVVLAHAAGPGLDFDDSQTVEELLGGLATAQEAEYATVRYADGKLLASWHAEKAAISELTLSPTEKGVPLFEREQDRLHVGALIQTDAGKKGTLQIGFSLKELKAEQNANIKQISALALALFALGSVLAALIGTFLARPIRSMTQVALTIANGDIAQAEAQLGGQERVRRMADEFEKAIQKGDEVAQLSGSFARMLGALRDPSVTMQQSAQLLTRSVLDLTGNTQEQTKTIAQQAEALQHAQVTAEEFRQTSEMAADQAASVLQIAERADELGRSGETSIEQSLSGLNDIRMRVEEIARQIGELSGKVLEIGGVTETVKELADQSHLLALNASIEAARSGEHGKGFAVIAREIRGLADQSIQGTSRIQKSLNEIIKATKSAGAITEEGVARIEGGLAEMRASGQNLRELSVIVKDASAAVRQIATAVGQQASGIDLLTNSVTDLSRMMKDTVTRIDSTANSVKVVEEVSQRIDEVAARYRT